MKKTLLFIVAVAFVSMFSMVVFQGVSAADEADPFPNVGNFESINNTGSGGSSGNFSNPPSCKNITDFGGLVGCFTGLINLVIPLIIGIALLVFVWGLVQYVTAGGEEKKIEEARKFIIFGLIALFVMVSVWGLVSILVNTFFPNGFAVPQLK